MLIIPEIGKHWIFLTTLMKNILEECGDDECFLLCSFCFISRFDLIGGNKVLNFSQKYTF
jgi:hypothetical protein